MDAPTNLLFYSTNTYLSHQINQRFYKGQHYVWCSPSFNPALLDILHPWHSMQASSSPHDIYLNYRNDATSAVDQQSPFAAKNKLGIKRGARIRLYNKEITEHQYQSIVYAVDNAPPLHYRPLLYVIPAQSVNGKIEQVALEETDNPLGIEFRVSCLLSDEFDTLEFKF
jgi:hypothetical protein